MKLSIYPGPDPEVLLVETHSELERKIGAVRVKATGIYNNSQTRVHSVVSKWIGVEEAVERELTTFSCNWASSGNPFYTLSACRSDKIHYS